MRRSRAKRFQLNMRPEIDALLRAAGVRVAADRQKARARAHVFGELVPDGAGGFEDPTQDFALVLDGWDRRHQVGYEILWVELFGWGRSVERLAAGADWPSSPSDGRELLTWYRGEASGEVKSGRGVVALFDPVLTTPRRRCITPRRWCCRPGVDDTRAV